jgi:hypothetical protein
MPLVNIVNLALAVIWFDAKKLILRIIDGASVAIGP